MTEQQENELFHPRADAPEEFDRRSCMTVLACLVCFWIAAVGVILWRCL